MTELARIDTALPAVVQQQGTMQDAAVERLGAWAQAAQAAYTVAERLVETSFVPQAFRGKAYEATAAILAGSEVGMSPMAALRSFDIIQGQAAPRAITLRAVVQSQGHNVWVKESTASRAIVCGQRRGSNITETSTWTLDRARDLALLGKDNWKKQPQAMLVARATSEVCRLVAADAILGIGYSLEELTDGVMPALEGDPAPVQSTTRRMGRAKPLPEPDPPAPEPDAEPDAVTAAQLKKIGASMRDAGITERPAALAYVAHVIGRDIASRNELTKSEASQVIEALGDATDTPTYAQRAQAATTEAELYALLEEVEEAEADVLDAGQKNVMRGLIASRAREIEDAS